MWNSKDVYYISDSTALLAEEMGKSMLCQFPEIGFNEEKIPFVREKRDAEMALARIMKQSGGLQPLIFCTIMEEQVRRVFDIAEVELIDLYGGFLSKLEHILEAKALHQPGFYRNRDDAKTEKRVEAIRYTLEHDDGKRTEGYDQADIILIGVSRTGKTPVSVYIATHMSLKAANFPMTADHLDAYELPADIIRNRTRAVGLTVTPQFLSRIREERYRGSKYASITTCKAELQRAEQLYMQHGIQIVHTEGKSIEELSAEVTNLPGICKKGRKRPPSESRDARE
ncbi:pyruvate, water dikinase regulatory protein [Candidatus Electronema sp. JC]|uniref:pyruvate, water dikinase regulatory protein n=1 Tax=Candidatus Electronema sp. JC TaxID=3401570 RepID=UPI003B427E87